MGYVSEADRRRIQNDISNKEAILSGWKNELRDLERQSRTREIESQINNKKDKIRGLENDIQGLRHYLNQ